MFYNRISREYPFESRRGYFRHNLGQTMQGGYGNWPRASFRNFEHFNTPTLNNAWSFGGEMPVCTPPADILETDEQFILEVALPGIVLDDVQLKIDGNVLTVCAKRIPTIFEERALVLQRELYGYHMVRHFEFDVEILPEQIEARLDRGILYINIPKVEVAMRIPVSSGMLEGHLPTGNKTRVTSKEVAVK